MSLSEKHATSSREKDATSSSEKDAMISSEKDVEAGVQCQPAHQHTSALGLLDIDDGVPRDKGVFAHIWRWMHWFDKVGRAKDDTC